MQPWLANMLNRGGRLTLVQTTMCAIPLHAMMSLDISMPILEALLKLTRAFMWKGRCTINGGHCLVAWDKVASPKDKGGLGLPNFQLLNLALRCRWAWLQRVDPEKTWSEFDLNIPKLSRFSRRRREWFWAMGRRLSSGQIVGLSEPDWPTLRLT